MLKFLKNIPPSSLKLNLMVVCETVLLLTACNSIDEDLSDCESNFELNYELRLVTNMTTEMQTQLTTQTDIAISKCFLRKTKASARHGMSAWIMPRAIILCLSMAMI